MECCRVLTAPTRPVLSYYTNLVVDECPGVAAGLQIAAIKLVTMTLVQILHAAERGAVGF